MNRAVKCDRHMTMDVFREAVRFSERNDFIAQKLGDIVSGGEPTENPIFLDIIEEYFKNHERLGVTTNGHWLVENFGKAIELNRKHPGLLWQVTYDKRYYPKPLQLDKRILRDKQVVVCTSVDRIYPQGRALDNHIPFVAHATKCANIKLVAMQLRKQCGGEKPPLKVILFVLRKNMFFCTPAIRYDGHISLGESDICKTIGSIWDDERTLVNNILDHRCGGCPEALEALDAEMKRNPVFAEFPDFGIRPIVKGK